MLLSISLGMVASSVAVRLMAYRIYLLPVSALLLGFSFYMTYRNPGAPRWQKILLWIAAALSVLLWSADYLRPLVPQPETVGPDLLTF